MSPRRDIHAARIRLSAIADDDYRGICLLALERYAAEIYHFPASQIGHHNRHGGWAAHTLGVMKIAYSCWEMYPHLLDINLLTAGAFFHDIGKLRQYQMSTLGLVHSFTEVGYLLGHCALGTQMVEELAQATALPIEKKNLLQHIILSHHARNEVQPHTSEAAVVAATDNLDSSLDMLPEKYGAALPQSFAAGVSAILGAPGVIRSAA